MQAFCFIAFLCFTAICGAGVILWETPANLLLFVVWFVILAAAVHGIRKSRRKAVAVALSHALLMAAIVIAAAAAPVKTIDAIRTRGVSLERTTYTVAELSEYCQFNRDSCPIAIRIPGSGSASNTQVVFSSCVMPLKQFIVELESQTGLSHRFSCCGNSYRVLYGMYPSFGLVFYPENSQPGYEWD